MATKRKGCSGQLPVEIWQQIAGYMSSRSWAKISRTCKAMHMVQPSVIDLNIRSESAMAWVQTHWGQAHSMSLHWVYRDVPWVMAHNAATLTSLKSLELTLQDDRSPTSAMLLTWLLAQASSLCLLSIQQPSGFVMPPLRNLRHLIMTSDEFSGTVVASIRQLRNLRTLCLGATRPAHEAECAECDLSVLPHLSDVALTGLVMPQLTLPRQCSLHLTGSEETLALDTWSGAASHGQLRSINVTDYGRHVVEEVPEYLRDSDCSALTWQNILELGEQGRPALFDPVSFRRLTHLKIAGTFLHIELPAMRLRVLHLSANTLDFTCEAPSAVGYVLEELRVVYKALKGCDIFQTVSEMTREGKEVSRVGVSLEWDDDEEYDGFLVTSPSSAGQWRCSCGACLGCLQSPFDRDSSRA